MSDTLTPIILPFRDDACLVRFSRQASDEASGAVQAFLATLEAQLPEEVTEVAPALASVLVRHRPGAGQGVWDHLTQLLTSRDWAEAPAPQPARVWHVPVCFEGAFAPQLAEVASLVGQTEAQTVAQVLTTDIRVLAIGFAPGQPYLGLLPKAWGFSRQETLTPKVPAGALVAAVRQLVLFANDSPTGWRHIGQTKFRPFQPGQDVAFPLRGGDGVQFHAVSAAEFSGISSDDPMGGAYCRGLA